MRRRVWMERWSCGMTPTLYRMCWSRLFSCSPQRTSTNSTGSRGEWWKEAQDNKQRSDPSQAGAALAPYAQSKLVCSSPALFKSSPGPTPSNRHPPQTKYHLTHLLNKPKQSIWSCQMWSCWGAADAVSQGGCEGGAGLQPHASKDQLVLVPTEMMIEARASQDGKRRRRGLKRGKYYRRWKERTLPGSRRGKLFAGRSPFTWIIRSSDEVMRTWLHGWTSARAKVWWAAAAWVKTVGDANRKAPPVQKSSLSQLVKPRRCSQPGRSYCLLHCSNDSEQRHNHYSVTWLS